MPSTDVFSGFASVWTRVWVSVVQAAAGADSDEYCMAMGDRAAVAGEYAAFWKAHTVGAQAHTQLGCCQDVFSRQTVTPIFPVFITESIFFWSFLSRN